MIVFLQNYGSLEHIVLQNFSVAGIAFNLILVRAAQKREGREHPGRVHSALQISDRTAILSSTGEFISRGTLGSKDGGS